jgi:hypothetical protein
MITISFAWPFLIKMENAVYQLAGHHWLNPLPLMPIQANRGRP